MNLGNAGILNLTNGVSTPQITPQFTLPAIPPPAAPAAAPKAAATTSGGAGTSATASTPAAPAGPSPLFTSQVGTVNSTEDAAGASSAAQQATSINDYIDSLKANQVNLDNQAVQNQLAKTTGTNSILDQVGTGIRSAGVTLANDNASNSSAADAVAKAYGQIGRGQLGSVNEQFAQGQNTVQAGEDAMKTDIAAHIRDLPAAKTQIINNIVSDAQQKLGAIDQAMAYMSLPDRVDMEAEKAQITQDVTNQLASLDQLLASGASGVTPASATDIATKANTLAQAGTAPDNAFSYTTDIPTSLQNTGPAASNIPLFTIPGASNKNTQDQLI